MSLSRKCILPLIVTKGSDQVKVSTSYKTRTDASVVRNYGGLLIELSQIVPDVIFIVKKGDYMFFHIISIYGRSYLYVE
jgi:hypothetical protein